METVKEWISDNLRYILLGVALVLVLVIAVAGVRAVSHLGSKKDRQPVKETEVQTEASTESIVEGETNAVAALVQNDADVLTTMTSYYSAKTNKDIDTLKKLDPSINEDQEKENLESSYVKSYTNIKTYSKEGPESDGCVVYVCYDGEVDGITTLVPSLTQFYLKKNEEGNYFIADITGDVAASQFVEEMRKSTEVQDLIDSVNKECEAAKNSDPVLKDFMSKYGNSKEEAAEDKEEESEKEKKSDGSEMIANDNANVRQEPDTSSDANILGALDIGQTVTVLGTEGDWTKIEFEDEEGYVKSEFLSTPENYEADMEANYYAPAAAGEDYYYEEDGEAA